MKRVIWLLMWVLLAATGTAAASDPQADARQVFQQYVQLGQAFDPRVADLYDDNAVIRNKRHMGDGQVRELSIPAARYKQMIREVMPAAKARGDRNTYSDVKYTPEGKRVRITATRYSELKKYASPVSILLEPTASGSWLIVEELTESRP